MVPLDHFSVGLGCSVGLYMNCFEIRNGRKLQKDDFTDAFYNLKVNLLESGKYQNI